MSEELAAQVGVQEHFKEAMDSGVIRCTSVKRQLAQYEAYLQVRTYTLNTRLQGHVCAGDMERAACTSPADVLTTCFLAC